MNRKLFTLALTAALTVSFATVACKKKEAAPTPEPTATAETSPATPVAPVATGRTATATIKGNTDADLAGTVTFAETPEGLKIVADLSGIDVDGKHGFHIHEGTECVGDFKSAGGHWNPAEALHATPPTSPRHGGDLGNVEVAKGSAHLEIISTDLSLDGANSVVGRAVILHAKEDDGKTQPTGNAGDRWGCGLVTLDGTDANAASAATATPATTPQ